MEMDVLQTAWDLDSGEDQWIIAHSDYLWVSVSEVLIEEWQQQAGQSSCRVGESVYTLSNI